MLSLLYIKYFCDAVRLSSVTAAAKANFVTQSAISQAIGKLEKSLQCSLLARHPNRFRLTPEGIVAYKHFFELLRQTFEIEEYFLEGKDNLFGDLDFACTRSFAVAVIPSYLKRFRSDCPDVKVNFFSSGRPDYIKQMLRSGTIDFGIGQDLGDFSGFQQISIYKGTYGLYVSTEISLEEEKPLGFIRLLSKLNS